MLWIFIHMRSEGSEHYFKKQLANVETLYSEKNWVTREWHRYSSIIRGPLHIE
jgi:hypothetical protein